MSNKYIPRTKFISPWLVLVLSVVTLGIYAYAWVSIRHEESVERPRKMSHWVVPIGVILLAILIGVIIMIASPFVISTVGTAAAVSVYGNYGLLLVAHILGAWWTVHFLQHTNTVNGIRENSYYLAIMAFFFSPILVAYAQYRLNEEGIARTPVIRVFTTVFSIILGISTFTLAYVIYPATQEINVLEAEYQSTREYITCHEELEASYPAQELRDEEHAAYLDDFEACEDLMQLEY